MTKGDICSAAALALFLLGRTTKATKPHRAHLPTPSGCGREKGRIPGFDHNRVLISVVENIGTTESTGGVGG